MSGSIRHLLLSPPASNLVEVLVWILKSTPVETDKDAFRAFSRYGRHLEDLRDSSAGKTANAFLSCNAAPTARNEATDLCSRSRIHPGATDDFVSHSIPSFEP